MQGNKTLTMVTVTALIVLLTASSTTARVPLEDSQPSGEITLAGTVLSKITYQGKLTDAGGDPLDGTYNLVFQLWDDPSAGSQQGVDIPKHNVPVTNGLFTVELDVPQSVFNGQGLWLQISVNGQPLSPRQALLPVPYALSLKPGAVIQSSSADAALHAENTAGGYGMAAYSKNNIGLFATNGETKIIPPPSGMIGAYSVGSGKGIVGMGGHTGVEGVGSSDGVKGESTDGNGVHGISTNGQAVYSQGDLYVTGAYRGDLGQIGGAPFPRPAFDSGWKPILPGQTDLQHQLGGDVDSYVVDMWCRSDPPYRYKQQAGYFELGGGEWGAMWSLLDANNISIYRFADDSACEAVRIRIWIYE